MQNKFEIYVFEVFNVFLFILFSALDKLFYFLSNEHIVIALVKTKFNTGTARNTTTKVPIRLPVYGFLVKKQQIIFVA